MELKKPKLILYFDVNKTIIIPDAAKGKSKLDMVLNFTHNKVQLISM